LKKDSRHGFLSAFSAVIAGIFLSLRLRVGTPMAGSGYEVDAIIVAILGGAVCGYAAIYLFSTIIAALLMAMLINFFTLSGINHYTQIILKIIVLFIGFIPIIIKGIMIPKEKKAVLTNSIINKSIFCTHCGAESSPNDTICMKCGCKL
jgi:ribosomal protein L40E